jgi:hypothetical protein
MKRNLDFYNFVIVENLKTYVILPTVVSNKHNNFCLFYVGILNALKKRAESGSVIQWYGIADPNPYANIRIWNIERNGWNSCRELESYGTYAQGPIQLLNSEEMGG